MTCYNSNNWKYIKGTNRKYKIYYDGRVWISTRKRFAICHFDADGYMRVWLDGKIVKNHILVAEHFHKKPKCNERLEVNHKDLDRGNPHGDNLEWTTHTRNLIHRMSGKKRGVRAKGSRFVATITIKGKSKYLGCFDNEADAYEAYSNKFFEVYGERPW